ncbi:hypothetical protein LEN26_017430 [Aphanomyces euteiches]|nr:hypothetical protein LEN26_017430 [Aphanomyces euteiches]KAH9129205.1 hypothetical protein AeMF1_000710 [Aphanomyces euteiches]KAH9130880.1 hypothetical protein AeNC1_019785 [Aphanomyces euteiches]
MDAQPMSYVPCAVKGCSRFAKRDSLCLVHADEPTPASTHKMQLHHLLHKQRPRIQPVKLCKIDKCPQLARIDGYCTKHNMQFSSRKRKCTVPYCSTYARSNGLCTRHGGGKPCSVPGCKSVSHLGHGVCRLHIRADVVTTVSL